MMTSKRLWEYPEINTGTMNKQFKYKGYKFNINVELNTRVERRPNGKRWHTVTINCMDFDNYYTRTQVLDKSLEEYVINGERIVKEYIDEKEGTPEYSRLSELGFK